MLVVVVSLSHSVRRLTPMRRFTKLLRTHVMIMLGDKQESWDPLWRLDQLQNLLVFLLRLANADYG